MKKDVDALKKFLTKHPRRWHSFADDAKTNKAILELFHKNYGLMIDWYTRQMFYDPNEGEN